jgi:hypothetical protein
MFGAFGKALDPRNAAGARHHALCDGASHLLESDR